MSRGKRGKAVVVVVKRNEAVARARRVSDGIFVVVKAVDLMA
jgi:hypothetical protein